LSIVGWKDCGSNSGGGWGVVEPWKMELHSNLESCRRQYRNILFLCSERLGRDSHIDPVGRSIFSKIMTTRRPSPDPSDYSTGYKPGEAHWRPGMSRSPTLSDSRYEHHSPRDRMYPTIDIRQPLYTEIRTMIREHRRQEDEARDSLLKQIRDHREQQDDLLVKIAMLSPRSFGLSTTSSPTSKY
jgi:hypothetical protein